MPFCTTAFAVYTAIRGTNVKPKSEDESFSLEDES